MSQAFIQDILTPLLHRDPLPELSPQRVWSEELEKAIAQGSMSVWFSCRADREQELVFKAGLHLLNDSLDASHTCSQQVENATGSYWHGIMHRMEGDYWNAKYWFRMAGVHPVQHKLAEAAKRMLQSDREQANEYANGQVDEHANGQVNEQANEHANGQVNEHTTVQATEHATTQATEHALLSSLCMKPIWDPVMFVDAVEAAETNSKAFHASQQRLIRKLQYREMIELLDYSYQLSCEGSLLEKLT